MLLNKLYSCLALLTTLDHVQKIIPIIIVDTSKLLPPISAMIDTTLLLIALICLGRNKIYEAGDLSINPMGL